MVEPELTEVGELHSLTDWQVSEASEEAELDEFCCVEKNNKTAPQHEQEKENQRKDKPTNKHTHTGRRDKHEHRTRREAEC